MTRSPAPTNMTASDGRASRPKEGDIGVVTVGDVVCPVRVVRTDASVGPMSGVVLGYAFRPVEAAWDPHQQPGALQVDRLLVPPFLVNKKPWTMRFVRRIAQRGFEPGERLRLHCFRAYNGVLYDDDSAVLAEPVEPVGSWGLQSYRTLDDQLSDALGIPRVPED